MAQAPSTGNPAPDFTLEDLEANPFRLSDLRGREHVVLVFNRGFV